jgi:hypothetical protein
MRHRDCKQWREGDDRALDVGGGLDPTGYMLDREQSSRGLDDASSVCSRALAATRCSCREFNLKHFRCEFFELRRLGPQIDITSIGKASACKRAPERHG